MSNLRFNIEGYTKADANDNLDYYMTDKDFWIVSGDVDNIQILQSVLDCLFNDANHDSRIYVGDYLQSQNRTRLMIKCQVCSKELSSYDPFMGHDKGKHHKKAVQQSFSKDIVNPNIAGIITFKSYDEANCSFEKGTLEDMLDVTSQPVIGYQFLYKELYKGEPFFTCHLCSNDKRLLCKRMNKHEAFDHVTSDDHMMKFLKIKYGLEHRSYEEAYEDFLKIAHIEGPLSSPLFTYHHSDIERTFRARPVTPSPVVLAHKVVNSEEIDADWFNKSTESFLAELIRLKKQMVDNDEIIKFLKHDQDAFALVILLSKILAKKVYEYGDKIDSSFKKSAAKVMLKSSQLEVPPLD